MIGDSHSFIEILILDNLLIFLAEEAFLKLGSLPVGTDKLLYLILKSANSTADLIIFTESSIKLSRGLLKHIGSLVDVLVKNTNAILKLTVFPLQDLETEFLIFNFLFLSSKVSLELEDSILLLFLDVMLIGYV